MIKETKHKWSQHVTENSHALELEEGIFTWDDPRKIAVSLKESAIKSKFRKGTPYQSAMSMLDFYINRAGKKLPPKRRNILEKAKLELKEIFNRSKSGDFEE